MIDESKFAGVVSSLHPDVVERTGRTSTEAYPFKFWQSFSLTGSDFSIDFCIECFLEKGGFTLSSDITSSEGVTVADYPSCFIGDDLPDEEKRQRIEAWLEGLTAFLRREAGEIVRRLVGNAA